MQTVQCHQFSYDKAGSQSSFSNISGVFMSPEATQTTLNLKVGNTKNALKHVSNGI